MFQRPFAFFIALFSLVVLSQAQSNPPAWSPTATYKIGDLVTYEGVAFQCQINETTVHPDPHTLSWGIYYVYSGPLPIPVGPGQVLTTLSEAWTYIAGARIANNSSITIELQSNYAETFSSSFSLDHPYGSKISIVGESGASATFTMQAAGFTLDSGHSLAELAGLTMNGPTGGTNQAPAIQVTQTSCVSSLQNITISNFDLGLFADTCSTIDNVRYITLSQFKFGGMEACHDAVINITYPLTIDGSMTKTSPGFGFYANGGTIDCQSCTVKDCLTNFYASQGGKLYANNSTSTSGTAAKFFAGYYANEHSFIYAQGSTHSGGQYGFDGSGGSYVDASDTKTQTSAVSYDYVASRGGIVDATGHTGGTQASGTTTDGSYVVGF